MITAIAHLLSVGFLTPFIRQLQGTDAKRLTRGRRLVNHLAIIRPVKEQTLHEYTDGGTIGLSMSCWRIDRECISSVGAISFSERVLISGFWSGPDVEDGWGYVEAYICREY